MKKTWLKWSLWIGAFLATLVVLYYAEENWQGARVLTQLKRELAARGELLDPKALVPPPIPDELNIAAAPIFAELYEKDPRDFLQTRLGSLHDFFRLRDGAHSPPLRVPENPLTPIEAVAWQKWLTGRGDRATAVADVLAEMEKYRPITEEARAALERPAMRWPTNSMDDPFLQLRTYTAVELTLGRFLVARADFEIESGNGEAALQDVLFMFRLRETLRNGLLIDFLVSVTCQEWGYEALAYGLGKRVWNAAQLRQLEGALVSLEPLADFQAALRRDRLLSVRFYEMSLPDQVRWLESQTVFNGKPATPWQHRLLEASYGLPSRGEMKMNEADSLQSIQSMIDVIDGERGQLDLLRQKKTAAGREGGWWVRLRHPYRALLNPLMEGSLVKAARSQVKLVEAKTACALELYRVKNGGLPATLDALVPAFLPQFPLDPLDGQPLRYRVEGGGYLLYSIGWNGRDDGGFADSDRKGLQGDWVWPSRPDLYRVLPQTAP